MSARTCLLCGKSLSRIWVGAGDDFCSREHGNQYRLKRGMDRLTEANKISSLMRRRENPKPITSAHLPLNSASSRRDFPEAKISAASGTRFPSLRPFCVASTPRIATVSGRYAQPVLRRLAGPSAPRQPDCSRLRFSARKTAPVAPVPRAALLVRIPRARTALLRDRILGSGSEHRGFGFRRPARAAAASPASPTPRAISPRIPAHGLEAVTRQVPQPLSDTRGFDVSSKPRTLESGWPGWRVLSPSLPAYGNATGIKWPRAARIGRSGPYSRPAPAVRECGPVWDISGLAGFPTPKRCLAAPEWGMPTPCVVALPLAPVRANGAYHLAQAPFAPQNSPFGYKEHQDK